MLCPDWLWKGSIRLLCLVTLFCPDLEGRSFDHCATEDGRPGICVVKIYCRESHSQPLLKCEGDDSYCCPIPTSHRSASETPKRPPDERTRSDSAPKRPTKDETPFGEGRYRPSDRSGPRKGPEIDDYESRYASESSGSTRPSDVEKPRDSRGSSDGKRRDISGYYPASSGSVRPEGPYEPRETYDYGSPSGPVRPGQSRPREAYDSGGRKPSGNPRPSVLDPAGHEETKRPRDTYDSDDRQPLGNPRPSSLHPAGHEETKRPREAYDSKQAGASRHGSSDPLRPDESNRQIHDRPQGPPRQRPYGSTGPRDADDSDRRGYTGQSRPRTQETDPPRTSRDNERPEIRFPGDRAPSPPRRRDKDIPAKEVQRNDPKLSGGKDRLRPPGRGETSPDRPRESEESGRRPPERDKDIPRHPGKKESDSRIPDLAGPPAPKPRVPACGVRPYDLFIAGGGVSDSHEWPWMAAIFRRFQDSRPKAFLCGGSLINTRFVLTAAHCFVNNYVILPASSFVVRLGSNYLDSGEEYTVADLILHHNHSGSDFFNDIALIRLAGRVLASDRIAPVCLPPPDMRTADLVGRTATVAGWGDVAYRTSGTRVLQHVTIPVVSNQECSSAYSRVRGAAFLARGTDHVICAGLKEGGKDACLGDSGGPLMLKHDSDQWVVIGIVSLGYKCAEPGFYGVYTRVTHYASWISGHTRQRH